MNNIGLGAILISAFLSQPLFAQNNLDTALSKMEQFFIVSDRSAIQINEGVCHLKQADTLDFCRQEIIYDVKALADTAHRVSRSDRAILQIGAHYTKFFGQTCWRVDMNATLFDEGKEQISYQDLLDNVIGFSIVRNIQSRTLINRHHIPFTDNLEVEYIEPEPPLIWEISEEIQTVCEYECRKAVTNFGGRRWIVWFTVEIPCAFGPWKLAGLPGLILKANDERGHYVFTAVSLKASEEPILNYKIKTHSMSKSKWLKYEYNIYKSPVRVLGNEGKVGFLINSPKTRKLELLDEEWSIPYNPIEFE